MRSGHSTCTQTDQSVTVTITRCTSMHGRQHEHTVSASSLRLVAVVSVVVSLVTYRQHLKGDDCFCEDMITGVCVCNCGVLVMTVMAMGKV